MLFRITIEESSSRSGGGNDDSGRYEEPMTIAEIEALREKCLEDAEETAERIAEVLKRPDNQKQNRKSKKCKRIQWQDLNDWLKGRIEDCNQDYARRMKNRAPDADFQEFLRKLWEDIDKKGTEQRGYPL